MARSGCNCKERYGRIRSNREVYDVSDRHVFLALLLGAAFWACSFTSIVAALVAVMALMQVAP